MKPGSLLSRMLWRSLSAKRRNDILAMAPAYKRRNIERLIRGQARYQPCFDRTHSLFIHVPKAAGRSVVRGLYDVRSVEHANAEWYFQLDADKYREYFTFTIVRNPWDRLLSAFTYLSTEGASSNPEDREWGEFLREFRSFQDFVCTWLTPSTAMKHILFTPQHLFICNRLGEIDLDFVGRFENLEADYTSIAERISGARSLPHINRSRNGGYEEHYNEEAKNAVAEIYKRDITLLDYKFGG